MLIRYGSKIMSTRTGGTVVIKVSFGLKYSAAAKICKSRLEVDKPEVSEVLLATRSWTSKSLSWA